MFEDTSYKYRVFVTDLRRKAEKIVFEYDGRANIESLIEESKNQIAMAKIPGKRFAANASFLQVVMLAFNLNKWLQLIGETRTIHFIGRRSKRHASSICILQPGLSRRAEKPLFVLRQTIPTRSTSTAL